MNYFLSQSIELANQRDYLDQLFRVYHMKPNNIREVNSKLWGQFEEAFNANKQDKIIKYLLDFDLFLSKILISHICVGTKARLSAIPLQSRVFAGD